MTRTEQSSCTHGYKIRTLFEDNGLMSYALQRNCAGETSSATTNDDKADLEGSLLCGFVTTRLDMMMKLRS